MKDRKSTTPNGIKIQASTKMVILFVLVFLGGGAGATGVLKGFSKSSPDEGSGHISDDGNSKRNDFNVRAEMRIIKVEQVEQGKEIDTLKADVSIIKKVQVDDVASRNAREVWERSKKRKTIKDYDRLLKLNKQRLSSTPPRPTCGDLECVN